MIFFRTVDDNWYQANVGHDEPFIPVGNVNKSHFLYLLSNEQIYPLEYLVENQSRKTLEGDMILFFNGSILRQKRIKVSPGCAESFLYLQYVKSKPQYDLIDTYASWLDVNANWMTENQLWWATWILEDGLDHWPDANQQDGSGRRNHCPFTLIWFLVAGQKNFRAIDGIANWAHQWTLEQFAKRPDGPIKKAKAFEEDDDIYDSNFKSWHNFTQTSPLNATVDLLYSDYLLTSNPLAKLRIFNIVERLKLSHTRHERACGNIAQCLILAAHIFQDDLYKTIALNFLQRDHEYSTPLNKSIVANASWIGYRLFADTRFLDLGLRFSNDLYNTVKNWNQQKIIQEMPFYVLDPLAYGRISGLSYPYLDNIWRYMSESRPFLPDGKKWWGDRGNRYLCRYGPHACSILDVEQWPSSPVSFPYSRHYPR